MTDLENASSTEDEETVPTTDTSTEEQDTEETTSDDGENASEAEKGTPPPEEDVEPPVRNSPQDFILQRKQKQLEKERHRVEELEQQLEEARSKTSLEDDDEVIPESAKELLAQVHQEKTQLEIKNFLYDNPEFKPYEKKMISWSKNPAYQSLPIEQLAYVVAGADMKKIGAEISAKADREAQESSTASGTLTGEMPKAKGVWDMSPEEFSQQQQKVMRAS